MSPSTRLKDEENKRKRKKKMRVARFLKSELVVLEDGIIQFDIHKVEVDLLSETL